MDRIEEAYRDKEKLAGEEALRDFEKAIMLQVLDTHWKEHLAAMDYLRQGIHLRGFAQKNPKQEYKREAFEMFGHMLKAITTDVIGILSKVEVRAKDDVDAVEEQNRRVSEQEYQYQSADSDDANDSPRSGAANVPYVRRGRKVGRNEPCPWWIRQEVQAVPRQAELRAHAACTKMKS